MLVSRMCVCVFTIPMFYNNIICGEHVATLIMVFATTEGTYRGIKKTLSHEPMYM